MNTEPRLVRAINWNRVEDPKDLEIWNRLTGNFWLPEKIPVSNDIPTWSRLTDHERTLVMRVFTGLTLLDTVQGTVGAVSLMPDSITPHEEAVYTNIAFMEATHAKSYSSIFSTLSSTREIDEAFRWSETNEALQKKANIVLGYYEGDDPAKRKVASTLLESFLFYSGFYLPMHYSSRGILTNTADVIRLIIRDECLTADHELLTPEGWKPISEIGLDDTVAQYDMDTRSISFADPVNVSRHVADHTWEFRNAQGHVSIGTSPRHRMLFERRGYAPGSEYHPEVVESEDVVPSRLNAYARILHGAPKSGGRDSMTPEEKLIVAICADGSYDRTTKNLRGELRRSGQISGTIPVRFSLSKDRKVDRLRSLSTEAGWVLKEGPSRPAQGRIRERRNFMLMVPVQHSDTERKLSSVSRLDQVSGSWCAEFIDELSHWDGHRVSGEEDRIAWGSVDPANADYVQAVAALAGYRTHRKAIEDDRKETFSTYHRLQILCSRGWTSAQSVSKVAGESREVYGIEVPSGFLLTRRGGSVTITGNSIHGYYIGYKFQKAMEKASPERRQELRDYTFALLLDLYDNEETYTEDLYDEVGWTEDVKTFLRYNANKALMNLGYDPLFTADQTEVSPEILSALSPNSNENHDFFSGSGSSYVIGKTESTDDEDWDF